ncbi:MAG: ABC transporter ATP-binding protein [Gemmataceae bacterium]|nr:ABC transporter ATP-binding protein [Gemmataceae bacterium]
MPATGTTSPTAGTAPSSTALELGGVSHSYGATPSLRGVSLAVERGRFLSLLGPSGCGKTTLLKIVGGYLAPSEGAVRLDGLDATRLPPERRNVGMVFQSYALFPHLSVRRNVAFGLEVRGVDREEMRRRVDAMLSRVGLLGLADRMPSQLSGGQQQRVALARALAVEPAVLLLDEPFASLDRHLREALRDELRQLQRATGVATVLVTHDHEEALALSDAVGVMQGGRLLQAGTPEEVYRRPSTEFVARFLGEANIIEGDLVRPEWIVVGEGDEAGTVVGTAFQGGSVLAEIAWRGLRLKARGRAFPSGEVRFRIAQRWRLLG